MAPGTEGGPQRHKEAPRECPAGRTACQGVVGRAEGRQNWMGEGEDWSWDADVPANLANSRASILTRFHPYIALLLISKCQYFCCLSLASSFSLESAHSSPLLTPSANMEQVLCKEEASLKPVRGLGFPRSAPLASGGS